MRHTTRAAPTKAKTENPVVHEEAKSAVQPAETAPVKTAAVTAEINEVRATPLARRIAKETGIDLTSLRGSGPKGRIQKKDVEGGVAGKAPVVTRPTAPAQSPVVRNGDAPLHAVWLREGNGSGRAPLVLIHGFGSDLNSWRPMLGGGNLDNPILALDLPGHGGSTHTIPDDLDGIAAQLEQTIAAYHSGPIILVGHSFGGAIATEIAARSNLDIRALVLIAPAGLGPEINGAFLSGFVRARTEASLVAWMKQLVQDESLLTKPFHQRDAGAIAGCGVARCAAFVADRFFADGTQVFDVRQSLGNLANSRPCHFRCCRSCHSCGPCQRACQARLRYMSLPGPGICPSSSSVRKSCGSCARSASR